MFSVPLVHLSLTFMIWVGGVRPSSPVASFYSEGLCQGHLLKAMWVGAGVRDREFKKSGDGVRGGCNSHGGE